VAKKLTATQRAAAIIIALGSERASAVYKYLKDEEIEQLSLEIAKLDRLMPEDMQETIEDFYGLCVTQKVINEGGIL
jgi:flagellar motor switch protein FliG